MEDRTKLCPIVQLIYVYVFQNLRRMEGDMKEPAKDLDELQNSDWVRRKSCTYFSKMSSATVLKL